MLSVPGARTRLRPAGGAAVGACAPVGDQDVVSLRAASGGMCRAWGRRRVPAVERGEAFSDHGDDGLFGPLGATAELARDGRGLSDQLGGGLSVGGMVGAVGPGAPRAAGGGVAGYRRDQWGYGLRAHNFLTVLYQIDASCRRLLWVGKGRSQRTLRRGLRALGTGVVQGVRFVCSDMWKPYLEVIGAQAGQALHVLDRFHITLHLNQAVDQVRRGESARLRAAGKSAAQQLTHMRWPLLRRGSRVRGRARQKPNALLASKLQTARAWELKESFVHFWSYPSVHWAGAFLHAWCGRAMRSRLEPLHC